MVLFLLIVLNYFLLLFIDYFIVYFVFTWFYLDNYVDLLMVSTLETFVYKICFRITVDWIVPPNIFIILTDISEAYQIWEQIFTSCLTSPPNCIIISSFFWSLYVKL